MVKNSMKRTVCTFGLFEQQQKRREIQMRMQQDIFYEKQNNNISERATTVKLLKLT